LKQQTDTKVLTQLGLTSFQAQVYLTLTKLGTSNAKTIASIDRLDRANVYRVMTDLQKLNLVEKMLTKPINLFQLTTHQELSCKQVIYNTYID